MQTQTHHDSTSTTPQTTTACDLQSSGGVSPGLTVGIGKAGYRITKAIGEHQQKRAKKYQINAGVIIFQANGNPMEVNRLIVPLCKKRIKRRGWTWTRVSWKMVR